MSFANSHSSGLNPPDPLHCIFPVYLLLHEDLSMCIGTFSSGVKITMLNEANFFLFILVDSAN